MLANHEETVYYDDILKAFAFFYGKLSLDNLIKKIVQDYKSQVPAANIAARFHNTITELFSRVAEQAREDKAINTVALSGGVFQNIFLFNGLLNTLKQKGFEVITHSLVPANDGGLALGQIAIAANRLEKANA